MPLRQRVTPARAGHRFGGRQPFAHGLGNTEAAAIVRQRIAVGVHNQMPERGLANQRRDFPNQLMRTEGRHRAAVRRDMPHFLAPQHGIDRHHHRIGAQDGEVSGNELRAVLAEQQHAVAALHAAAALQVARHALHFLQQGGIADRCIVEINGRLVGKAPRRHLEVVEQRRLRHVQVLGHAVAGILPVEPERALRPFDHAGVHRET
ncbi:hypothetical protein D9M72_505760 [compost metagenome]